MDNIDNPQINIGISSGNGSETLSIQTQRDHVVEFMKVLSLAHMCVPESFTDKKGNKSKFYNGPSPDEVALVEFASS